MTRRRFRRRSLQTGAYELIPFPFVDDWLIARERRRMVKITLEGRGFTLDPKVARLLAGGEASWIARLGSLAKGLVFKPLKKLFRTAFFWLSVRNAGRTAVATYFLGRFLHHPQLQPSGGRHVTDAEARRWAAIFEEASRHLDLKAAGDAIRRVNGLLRGRSQRQVRSEEVEAAIEKEVPDFIDDFDEFVARRLGEKAV